MMREPGSIGRSEAGRGAEANRRPGFAIFALGLIAGLGLAAGLGGAAMAWRTYFKKESPSRRSMLSQARSCRERLVELAGAKEQWALENNKALGAAAAEEELFRMGYLKEIPKCPQGGAYTLNPVGSAPVCSSGLPGHDLSEPASER